MNIIKRKNICFFYPSKHIGGAELLFYRYFNILEKNEVNVKFLVVENDEIYFNWVKDRSKFIFLNEIKNSLNKNNITIITPPPICYSKEFIIKIIGCKLIIWSIHPGLLTQIVENKYRFLYRKSLSKKINEINEKKSLWFLDNSCYILPKRILNLKFTPNFKPLMIENNNYHFISISKKNIVRVAFVQRMVKTKLTQVIYILNNFKKIDKSKQEILEIHIIGEGPDKYLIEEYKNVFKNIYYHGFMENHTLVSFLKENIDVTFGMGQTILDASLASNLSVILDLTPINTKFIKLKFDFIYQIKEYTLGNFYEKNLNKSKANTIEEIIKIIFDEKRLILEKKECFNFAFNNFVFENKHIIALINDINKAEYIVKDEIILNTHIMNFLNYYRKLKHEILSICIKPLNK